MDYSLRPGRGEGGIKHNFSGAVVERHSAEIPPFNSAVLNVPSIREAKCVILTIKKIGLSVCVLVCICV